MTEMSEWEYFFSFSRSCWSAIPCMYDIDSAAVYANTCEVSPVYLSCFILSGLLLVARGGDVSNDVVRTLMARGHIIPSRRVDTQRNAP